jgi:predicted NAD-dependent protein-ADP-ribosyltransferase YbiA (DUF1768 family)
MEYISFTKTKLPYGWLGNMYTCLIEYNGKTYKSTEALFQSLRFDDENIIEEIRCAHNGFSAKLVAKKYRDKYVIEPLCEQDIDNMRLCLKLKIKQHPNIKQQLIETYPLPIYEDVTKRGPKGSNLFWGAINENNNWEGKNILGELWMQLRNEIISSETLF